MRRATVVLHAFHCSPFMVVFIAGMLVLLAFGVEAGVQDLRLQFAADALAGRTIVVDAGHGGIDPGAAGHGVVEREVVLAVAQDLRQLLARAGARVIMTRTGREAPSGKPFRQRRDLAHRAQLANAAGADVLVSIHANYFSHPGQQGAQVFVNRAALPQSRRLAELIQQAFREVTGSRRQVVTGADIFLLKKARMPAVTVEIGFLSHPAEARNLLDPAYQNKLAWCVFLGLARYFAEGAAPG